MSATKFKKIVFVCTGNTCRSPMAEYLLKKALKKKKLRGFKVVSVGTKARKGDVMNEKSERTLAENGIAIGKFSSSPIAEKILKEALFFVCMTEAHKDLLMELRWQVLRNAGEENIENNVYSFGELVGYDVPDPFGRDIEAYRCVYDMLDRGMSAIIEGLDLKNYALPTRKKIGEPGKRGRPKKNVNT